jgi:hypothetical protein
MCWRSSISKKIVVTFSILAMCGGLALVGLTLYFIQDRTLFGQNQIKSGTSIVAIITGIAGGVAVIYGLLGVLTARVHRLFCVCSFGLLSIIVLAYFTAIAAGLMIVVTLPSTTVTDFCSGE